MSLSPIIWLNNRSLDPGTYSVVNQPPPNLSRRKIAAAMELQLEFLSLPNDAGVMQGPYDGLKLDVAPWRKKTAKILNSKIKVLENKGLQKSGDHHLTCMKACKY